MGETMLKDLFYKSNSKNYYYT